MTTSIPFPRFRTALFTLALLATSSVGGPPPSLSAASPADEPATPWAQTGGAMRAAVEFEDLLWIGIGPRIAVLDLSIPASPQLVARSSVLPGVVNDLAMDVDRSQLWVAAGDELLTFDVDDPRLPRVVARAPFGEHALRVVIDAGRVWAMGGAGAVAGFAGDARGVHAPLVRIPAPAGQRVAELAAGRGELLRLGLRATPADAPLYIDRWNVSDPDAPRPLPSFDLPGEHGYLMGHERLLWQADRLWVLHERGLSSLRFEKDGPTLASHDDLGWGGVPIGFALRGERAYASFASGWSDNFGVGVFDLSDPDDIVPLTDAGWIIGRYPGVFTRAAAIVGNTFWVSSSGGFLTGLGVAPESFMRLAGVMSTIGEATALERVNGRLVATSNQSMQFVDTDNPLAPTHGAMISAGYHYGNVTASGDLLAIAVLGQSDMLNQSLHLVRRAGPRGYERVAELDSPLPGAGGGFVALEGSSLVYAVSSLAGGVLTIYDLRDPTKPLQVGRSAVSGRPTALSLANGTLLSLVLDGGALRLLRHRVADHALLDSTSQPLRGGLDEWADTWMARADERVVVLARDADPDAPTSPPRHRQFLAVLDVPPEGPMMLRSSTELGCPDGARPADIALDGEYLLVACTGDEPGVAVLDLADAEAPRRTRYLRIPVAASGLAVADGHLYLVAGAAGMLVYPEPPDGWAASPVPPPTATVTVTATMRVTRTPVATASPSGTPEAPTRTPTPSGATIWLPVAHR